MADIALHIGELQQARELSGGGYIIREQAYGAHHPILVESLVQLAEISTRSGKYDIAIDDLKRARHCAKHHAKAHYNPTLSLIPYFFAWF